MKYRKRPVIVEAQQWRPGLEVSGVNSPMRGDHGDRHYVVTAHGQMAFIEPDDWIIAEPDGRGYYPCKPDIFAATYELVQDGGK